MLVDRAACAIRSYGNEPATPAEAREMLKLKPLEHDATCAELDKISIEWLENQKQELEGLSRANMGQQQGMGGKN